MGWLLSGEEAAPLGARTAARAKAPPAEAAQPARALPDARSVMALQRSAGNRSVAALLETSSPGAPLAVQRCGATPCGCSAEEREAHEAHA